jgi:transposase
MEEPLDVRSIDESARTTSRRSARNLRMEIITRGERRRSWSAEQKDQIVAESLGPDLTPTEVARKHWISSGQLYTWRQQRRSVQTALVTRAAPRFAEVELIPAPSPAEAADPKPVEAARPSSALAPSRPEGLIEIVLPGGMVVRMDAHVDGRALRRVLGALEGR